jgi:hypothetical protein
MRNILCPICHKEVTIQMAENYNGPVVTVSGYLFQVSYPGCKEYISPRCPDCYDKLIERRKQNVVNL